MAHRWAGSPDLVRDVVQAERCHPPGLPHVGHDSWGAGLAHLLGEVHVLHKSLCAPYLSSGGNDWPARRLCGVARDHCLQHPLGEFV